jgi:hypothetical protein
MNLFLRVCFGLAIWLSVSAAVGNAQESATNDKIASMLFGVGVNSECAEIPKCFTYAGPYHEEWGLLLLYLTDREERVREASVEHLAEVRTPGSASALMVVLRDDPSPLVRKAAVKSLFALRQRMTTCALSRAASDDRDPKVRQLANLAAQIMRTAADAATRSISHVQTGVAFEF